MGGWPWRIACFQIGCFSAAWVAARDLASYLRDAADAVKLAN